jgi:ATP synthase F1 epsilon subunit
MAGHLQLEILTPAGTVYDEPVYEVVVPTTGGDLGILPGHTPLTTVTKLGVVAIRRQQNDTASDLDHVVVSTGVAEISDDRVHLLVDEAEHTDTIDKAMVNQELAAAQQRLQTAADRVETAAAEAAAQRAAMWLKASDLGRSNNSPPPFKRAIIRTWPSRANPFLNLKPHSLPVPPAALAWSLPPSAPSTGIIWCWWLAVASACRRWQGISSSVSAFSATVIVQDLAEPDAAAALVEQLTKAKTPIDMLVNNAGFGVSGRLVDADSAQLAAMVQVNVAVLTELCRLLVPSMVAQGHGRVLNVASTAAYVFPAGIHYLRRHQGLCPIIFGWFACRAAS